MGPIQIPVQERDRKFREHVTSAEERRYVGQHVVPLKTKAQSAAWIGDVNLCRYVVMRSRKTQVPNAQLVGAQVECATLAEHLKSGDQAKGTYLPKPIRGFIYNARLDI